MNNSMLVGSLKTHTNLNGYTGRFLNRKLPFFGNIFFECDAFDQFHDNVINTVIISDIIYAYNIRVGQTGCRLRFGELGIVDRKFD